MPQCSPLQLAQRRQDISTVFTPVLFGTSFMMCLGGTLVQASPHWEQRFRCQAAEHDTMLPVHIILQYGDVLPELLLCTSTPVWYLNKLNIIKKGEKRCVEPREHTSLVAFPLDTNFFGVSGLPLLGI